MVLHPNILIMCYCCAHIKWFKRLKFKWLWTKVTFKNWSVLDLQPAEIQMRIFHPECLQFSSKSLKLLHGAACSLRGKAQGNNRLIRVHCCSWNLYCKGQEMWLLWWDGQVCTKIITDQISAGLKETVQILQESLPQSQILHQIRDSWSICSDSRSHRDFPARITTELMSLNSDTLVLLWTK